MRCDSESRCDAQGNRGIGLVLSGNGSSSRDGRGVRRAGRRWPASSAICNGGRGGRGGRHSVLG